MLESPEDKAFEEIGSVYSFSEEEFKMENQESGEIQPYDPVEAPDVPQTIPNDCRPSGIYPQLLHELLRVGGKGVAIILSCGVACGVVLVAFGQAILPLLAPNLAVSLVLASGPSIFLIMFAFIALSIFKR